MNYIKKHTNYFIYFYLFSFFIINILFLTNFPFVHSDESWLSGLTRNMIETKNIFCTESFFNLYPRYPHAIKTIFHLIQMPFIKLIGYNIFSVRLISLVFSLLNLYFFYLILYTISKKISLSILCTILFSINIQFIYASHFARQEIIIMFSFLIGTYRYLSVQNSKIKTDIILGTIIGLSIGIHPNSFIISVCFGLLYLYDIIKRKKEFKNLLVLISTVSIFSIIFVSLSFIADPMFIEHYKRYGSSLGVTSSITDKLKTLDDFYLKLYHSISATYFTPNIKPYLISFFFIVLISLVVLFLTKISRIVKFKALITNNIVCKLLIIIFGINIGIVLIGRYNATSVLFIFPFIFLLFAVLINDLIKNIKIIAPILIILILLSAYLSFSTIYPYLNYSYNDYLLEISKSIKSNEKTLANLNSEFYFDNNALLDYRNLAFLNDNNISFEDYINDNKIEYIVFTEELEYIHRNPKWTILYGDDRYYEDMVSFLNTKCSLKYSFSNPVYGIRIPRFMFDYDWSIWIYHVD